MRPRVLSWDFSLPRDAKAVVTLCALALAFCASGGTSYGLERNGGKAGFGLRFD